jgi:hypothetical protein
VEGGRGEPKDTLLLYCPYDRRVTRHARRGADQSIVCVECGRPVEYSERESVEAQPPAYEQSTARFSPVTEPPPARRSQARPRPRQAHAGWLPFAVAVVALGVGILAAVNVAGNLAAPAEPAAPATRPVAATTAPGSGAAAATQGGQGPQTAPVPPAGDQTAFLRIANTGGEGAYLRRTTNMDDRLRAWPDNTRLQVIGPDAATNGTQWKNVQDPAGNQGWIPAQFTRPE